MPYVFEFLFKDQCDAAGAKTAGDHKVDASPASTIPADDEAAIALAKASYQSARMKTPEDKIRRAPATPTAHLSREVQSVEFLKEGENKKTEKDQNKSNGQKSKVNKKKSSVKTRKTVKRQLDKSKKNKQTAKNGAKNDKIKGNEPATKPDGTTTSPGTDASATPALSGSTTSPGASSTLTAPQPARRPSMVIGSPDLTENRSPAPGAVEGLLNRAPTTADLEESQRVAQQVAQAAVRPVAAHETHVRDGTRVRVRNKEYHNRRMRFYRSLDSFLTQIKEKLCVQLMYHEAPYHVSMWLLLLCYNPIPML